MTTIVKWRMKEMFDAKRMEYQLEEKTKLVHFLAIAFLVGLILEFA